MPEEHLALSPLCFAPRVQSKERVLIGMKEMEIAPASLPSPGPTTA